jgi:DNA-binding MarR family transcriptional regulator
MRNDAPLETAACVCARLRRASRAMTQLYDDLMAPSGLRVTQFSLLRTLARRGASCLSELAEVLLLDRTALSRTLDPLAERGLVAIAAGRDARRHVVILTPAGEKAIRRALPQWQHVQAQVAAALGAPKVSALIATLAELEAMHPDPGGCSRSPRKVMRPPSTRTARRPQ